MSIYRLVGKRAVDLCVAVPALVALSPLMAFVSIMLRIDLGSPVLFRQPRPGFNERLFVLVKFRTMIDACDSQGELLPDEQRLTWLGRLLRSTSLDELPTLINVVRGDMSLVGPRPLLVEYLPLYDVVQRRRHTVRPGMTGWAQVNGRNSLTWAEKLRMDVWYVENYDLALDVRILARTVIEVLRRRGINAPGVATMTKFVGTVEESRT